MHPFDRPQRLDAATLITPKIVYTGSRSVGQRPGCWVKEMAIDVLDIG